MRKIWVQKIKTFGKNNLFDPNFWDKKNFLGSTKFGLKKFLDPKNFGEKKTVVSKKYWGPKKCGWNKMLVQKIWSTLGQ